MPTVIRMPSVLAGADEGAIAAWLVAEGDEVTIGEAILEIETDKATVEYQAEAAGIVGRILVPAGTVAQVGNPIALLFAAGEDIARAEQDLGLLSVEAPTDPRRAGEQNRPPADAPDGSMGDELSRSAAGETHARLFASPIARKTARENGIDLAELTGSGPGARITRRDVEAALRSAQPTQAASAASDLPSTTAPAAKASEHTVGDEDATLIPHSPMRRAIARRLTQSQATIPQFQIVAECIVDNLLALREQINATLEGRKLSINDFVVKAVAGALDDVPEANVTWTDEGMLHHTRADIAVAVATEDGLITPVVRDVGSRSISAVGAAMVELAERARARRLTQAEIEGGTFTISNLGMFGVTGFSAIVNPPHWGILAVGAAKQHPVVMDGALAVATVMRCTLSVDHRAADGALAARWLAAFQRRIEDPLRILV